MNQKQLTGARARLHGLLSVMKAKGGYTLQTSLGKDYKDILAQLVQATGDNFGDFDLPAAAYRTDMSEPYVIKEELESKVEQLSRYIDDVYRGNDQVAQIGSIYNSIKDDELKRRCSDLLSGTEDFDRVINQATQVLEDRIRKKVSGPTSLSGSTLVNTYIKPKVAKSPLELSADDGEQEGFANIFRGVVGAFRNPSHHGFIKDMTRESALQIAGFVDHLLSVLASGKVK